MKRKKERSLLNEASLRVKEFRKALILFRVWEGDFLEGDELLKSLYVRVSVIEERRGGEFLPDSSPFPSLSHSENKVRLACVKH